MSQLKYIEAISSSAFSNNIVENAFFVAMEKIKTGQPNALALSEIKEPLCLAGFSQNGRNRIIHLSAEEIDALCTHVPKEKYLLPAYVNEIQLMLSKMDQARKKESFLSRPPFMGRPYVTIQLASTIGKLTALRSLSEFSIERIATWKLRAFMMEMNEKVDFFDLCRNDEAMGGTRISVGSCIRLLELYSDELITPPRLKCKSNFDEYDLHMIETSDFSWMEDGGEAYLEAIRDIPFVTHYDELPNLDTVLDWFLATNPVLDSNQIKRGWAYVESAAQKWHQRASNFEMYGMGIYEYPSWDCIAVDHLFELNKLFPAESPYKIIPLNSPKQLLAESEAMDHCVWSYIESCLSGETRIFSVLEASNNKPVATAELSNHHGQWNLVQLKGKCNEELIHRVRVTSDPLAIALEILVNWYNQNSPK